MYYFLIANAISLIGNNLTIIAIPWFVLETTGSPAKMGLVGLFTVLPAVIAAFFGGTIVDRAGHKRMSILADISSGVTVALIPLLYSTVGLAFWQLLLLVFFSALLDAPGNTARLALLPDVAESSGFSLERANAAQQLIHRASFLVGPIIAGALITIVGTTNVLWLDALSFGVSATLFAVAVPGGKAAPVAETGYLQELRDGLRFIRADRLILTLVITVAITNFLDTPLFAVVLPVFAKQFLGNAAQLGLMISVFGAGAVLGTLLYGAFAHRFSRRWTFVTAFLLVSIPFWIVSLAPPLPIVLAALFCSGVAAGPLNPVIMTVTQSRVPAEMRGRVFGMMSALAFMAAPLGMVVTGYCTERLGVSTTLAGIAFFYLLVTAIQAFNPTLRDMDDCEPLAVGQPAVATSTGIGDSPENSDLHIHVVSEAHGN
ncbi:MAG: MFS transporter [Caldilineaceae bacterium]